MLKLEVEEGSLMFDGGTLRGVALLVDACRIASVEPRADTGTVCRESVEFTMLDAPSLPTFLRDREARENCRYDERLMLPQINWH